MPVLPDVGSINVSPGLMRPELLGVDQHLDADAIFSPSRRGS